MKELSVFKGDAEVLQALRLAIPTLSKVSDDVLITAMAHAKYLNLDPLKKEVHFIPFYNEGLRKNVVQLVVAYTEYIKRAEESGKLKGWTCEVEKREDDYYAITTIYRADWDVPFVWKVPLKEVQKQTSTWRSQPLFMLRKVCISQAFRLCFPKEVSALPYTYEEAEMMGREVLTVIGEAEKPKPKPLPKNIVYDERTELPFFNLLRDEIFHKPVEELNEDELKTLIRITGYVLEAIQRNIHQPGFFDDVVKQKSLLTNFSQNLEAHTDNKELIEKLMDLVFSIYAPGKSRPKPTPQLLTDKQRKLLFIKAKEYGLTHDELKAFLKDKFGYESTKEIPADKFTDILNELPTYVNQKAKATQNDEAILNEFREIYG